MMHQVIQSDKRNKRFRLDTSKPDVDIKALVDISILCFQYMKNVHGALHSSEDDSSCLGIIVHSYDDDMVTCEEKVEELIIYERGKKYSSFRWRNLNFQNVPDTNQCWDTFINNLRAYQDSDYYQFVKFGIELTKKFEQYLDSKECQMKPSTKILWDKKVFTIQFHTEGKGYFNLQFCVNKNVY